MDKSIIHIENDLDSAFWRIDISDITWRQTIASLVLFLRGNCLKKKKKKKKGQNKNKIKNNNNNNSSFQLEQSALFPQAVTITIVDFLKKLPTENLSDIIATTPHKYIIYGYDYIYLHLFVLLFLRRFLYCYIEYEYILKVMYLTQSAGFTEYGNCSSAEG